MAGQVINLLLTEFHLGPNAVCIPVQQLHRKCPHPDFLTGQTEHVCGDAVLCIQRYYLLQTRLQAHGPRTKHLPDSHHLGFPGWQCNSSRVITNIGHWLLCSATSCSSCSHMSHMTVRQCTVPTSLSSLLMIQPFWASSMAASLRWSAARQHGQDNLSLKFTKIIVAYMRLPERAKSGQGLAALPSRVGIFHQQPLYQY